METSLCKFKYVYHKAILFILIILKGIIGVWVQLLNYFTEKFTQLIL